MTVVPPTHTKHNKNLGRESPHDSHFSIDLSRGVSNDPAGALLLVHHRERGVYNHRHHDDGHDTYGHIYIRICTGEWAGPGQQQGNALACGAWEAGPHHSRVAWEVRLHALMNACMCVLHVVEIREHLLCSASVYPVPFVDMSTCSNVCTPFLDVCSTCALT
jgi:hypothetical protein